MNRYLRITLVAAAVLAILLAAAVGGFYGLRAYYESRLPSVASLHELKLGVPLRVFSHDGRLIGEFGAERRDPLHYSQIPPALVHAFLAAEDDRFFEHRGVDLQGLARASVVLATTGEKRQGGSTITMQLARNVFLSPERSYSRKIKEILLALKIERELTKEQILELYLNRIFLGNRAYGVGAAAQVYFGKDVQHLTLGEMATLAGLPKAPSRDNPIADPDRARERRDYVLRRMHELRFIDPDSYRRAQEEPITAHEHLPAVEVQADYVAEMVRAEMVARYGDAAYTDGLNVTTTIDAARQTAATAALRGGILAYEERHGYRGAEARLPPEALAKLDSDPDDEEVQAQLEARPQAAALVPGVVLEFGAERLRVLTANGVAELPRSGFEWAHQLAKKPLQRGDIVRLARVGGAWRLEQLPAIEGALIALDPTDGAVQALVGGFDFHLGAYNRVTQARRQPGSGFKPFLYTAALAKGYTPASVFLDAPVVYVNANPDDDWRPGNYEGKFSGPMRLREALAESRNLVSIRVLQALGLDYALNFLPRFGLPKERLPHDLTLALGSGTLTPWEVVRGYAVFANGGFLVDPYFIESVRAGDGKELFRAHPKLACPVCDTPPAPQPAPAASDPAAPAPAAAAAAEPGLDALPPPVAEADRAPRVLGADLDYLITSMMHDVVTHGTGAAVRSLGRDDLAGKTGTSNDFIDAWFNGFNPALVTTVWVGHDQPASLGHGEVGARAALPIWMDFMKAALQDVPQQSLPRPPGIVDVLVNPVNGKQVPPGTPGAATDIVQADHLPPQDDGQSAVGEQQTSSEIY